MWRVNRIGKEQVWYEAELIEKIKRLCQAFYTTDVICGDNEKHGKWLIARDILNLIEQYEKDFS